MGEYQWSSVLAPRRNSPKNPSVARSAARLFAALFAAKRAMLFRRSSRNSGGSPAEPACSRVLTLEELLEKMTTINLVQRVAGQGWVMIRAPEHVLAIELYRLFVFDPSKPPAIVSCEGINAWLARLAELNAKTAAVSLRTLFNEAAIVR